ncbi:hypothetical protein ACC703_38515, partial [Rhizobium ruizarguesonis]
VGADMRPRDEDYLRFIHLVDTYAACGWYPARQWEKASFKVAEIQTTAILLKAGEDLEHLARLLGRTQDSIEKTGGWVMPDVGIVWFVRQTFG